MQGGKVLVQVSIPADTSNKGVRNTCCLKLERWKKVGGNHIGT